MNGTNERRKPLVARWSIQRCAPGVAPVEAAWMALAGPGTVAAVLRSIGLWSLEGATVEFDAHDWWYRAVFESSEASSRALEFGGLAGLCEVWLDDRALLGSSNMFLRHRSPELPLRAGRHELRLRFASLAQWLEARRPRPRWRTPMVAHQQLRWARVSLLGRTPGWSPPAAAVGPWRPIEWVEASPVEASGLRWSATVEAGVGLLRVDIDLKPAAGGAAIESAVLDVERDGLRFTFDMVRDATGRFVSTARVPDVSLWWPHTHGDPALYDARLRVRLGGEPAPVAVTLGRIGFRTLELDTADGGFALRVNGVPIFCRGACWTPLDVVSLQHSAEACRAALEQARDAGMNMLRVAGTMVYEDDAFHDACDALGLMVWQDFMFANMDYPTQDPDFVESARQEASQQMSRWQGRPSIAVLCGNSEVSQQAAMWGAAREEWSQPFFERDLRELAAGLCPGVPWWPSSAHGGAFPQQNNVGTTAYYGVGAYLRPLEDARRSGLRFATECLALANLPPESTLRRSGLRPGHPAWKAHTPRDAGAAWDFEDVRDHYVQTLYRVDAAALRRADPERYVALGRAVSAEVMNACFAEWRRPGSSCHGALVWFLRDFRPGAGWGLLDDQGAPKAAFHGLRRALAPVALFISDEGTNGLALHVLNDAPTTFAGTLELGVFRDDGLRLQSATLAVELPAHGALTRAAIDCFERFTDLSFAYRFGPPEHALVVATLLDATGAMAGQAFHFTHGLPAEVGRSVGLAATAHRLENGEVALHLSTENFAQSLQVDVPGFTPEDEFFHLAPGARRVLRLRPQRPDVRFSGSLRALNDRGVVTLGLA